MTISSIIEDSQGNVIGVRYQDETSEIIPLENQLLRYELEAEPGTAVEAAAAILAE